MPVQGSLSVERMCQVAVVSRAGYYRSLQEHSPVEEEMLVRADSAAGLVSIHVDGPEQERRELLAIVRYNFRVIHSDYEFKPDELVYPPGVPERPQRLDDLEGFLRSGAASTIPHYASR